MKIDLGCGKNKKQGFIGVDCCNFPEVDIHCNINDEKLPLENDSVDEIISYHTLEHCNNIIFIMNEIFRVCKNNAKVHIIVPYGVSHQWIQDPTHKTAFNEDTFRKYFCNSEYVKTFSDYGIVGFFKEESINIIGKDILHLTLDVKLKVKK